MALPARRAVGVALAGLALVLLGIAITAGVLEHWGPRAARNKAATQDKAEAQHV